MSHLYIGGVNLQLPWWGFVPAFLPPSTPSPEQITRMTVIPDVQRTAVPGGTASDSDSPGMLDHVEPLLGAAGLIIGAGLKLHPATKVAGLLIGVGIAVLNWGSEPAGGSQVDSNGGGGGF